MLAPETMEIEYVETEISGQYVDHNLLRTDNKNPDDSATYDIDEEPVLPSLELLIASQPSTRWPMRWTWKYC